MIQTRGTSGAHQMWADQVSDQSYTFENLLPFFKRSIDWTPPFPEPSNITIRYNTSSYLPRGGPLQVSYPSFQAPISSWWTKTFEDYGIPAADDFAGGSLEGIKYIETTINPKTHLRSSSESSYLQNASGRKNLHFFTFTRAEKILFDGKKAATGVLANGTQFSASKEVILSAGTLLSPHLLMLSDIGPRFVLENNNISVLVDSPKVGQDMTDQLLFGPGFLVNLPTAVTNASTAEALALWQANHTGPLTAPGGPVIGWSKFNRTTIDTFTPETRGMLNKFAGDWPDFQYAPIAGFVGDGSGKVPPSKGPEANYGSLYMGLMKIFSRGNVTLNSASPVDLPKVNPNWLTYPADQEIAVAVFKQARQLIASDTFRPLLPAPAAEAEVYPGYANVSTDAEMLKFAMDNSTTYYHAAGTCKMGSDRDASAVVDAQMRVQGVKKLRVVDASIFPVLPPSHPQSTIYALAEKLAAELLADANP